jgi:hypothetical protein
MGASFSVSVDPQINLVWIEMVGFFTESDVAEFTQQLDIEMETLRCLPNEHLTLCDVSGMNIQAQEIVAQFSKVVGNDRFRSKRLAFVIGPTLVRKQAERLADRAGVQFFKDIDEAQTWLLEA